MKNIIARFSDFKKFDFKNPLTWTLFVRLFLSIAVSIILLAAFFVVDLRNTSELINAEKKKELELRTSFEAKKRVSMNFDLLKKQYMDAKSKVDVILKQLPSQSEMSVLLTDINQTGINRGLTFDLFKPETEVNQGDLTEQKINIKVSGDYDSLGYFVSDVAALSRLVILSDISLLPMDAKDSNGKITLTATAVTYRLSDKGELPDGKSSKE